ncbi:MAG TPA: SMP-30/gluconolactonase/LRE family protein [Methylophilaceae bacterium]|nr:SMP-30/gluconolactonase/LRE family protein [Methylophilaceae bacterium]
MNKKLTLSALLAASLMTAAAAQAEDLKKVGGFKSPESVLATTTGRVYVSEIGEFGKDGDGQISVIEKDGSVKPYAIGLDDPKGLALVGNALYVADKTRVMKISTNGKVEVFAAAEAFPVKPQFLNDLEADGIGNLYVSDSGDLAGKGGAIYRINKNGKVTTVVDGTRNPLVQGPNGLLNGGRGTLLEVDFVSGTLYRVSLGNGELTKLAEGFGGGDGLVRGIDGMLYVSDWKNGKVYSVDREGKVKLLKEGFKAAADIALATNGKALLVPDMKAGEVVWLPLLK